MERSLGLERVGTRASLMVNRILFRFWNLRGSSHFSGGRISQNRKKKRHNFRKRILSPQSSATISVTFVSSRKIHPHEVRIEG